MVATKQGWAAPQSHVVSSERWASVGGAAKRGEEEGVGGRAGMLTPFGTSETGQQHGWEGRCAAERTDLVAR